MSDPKLQEEAERYARDTQETLNSKFGPAYVRQWTPLAQAYADGALKERARCLDSLMTCSALAQADVDGRIDDVIEKIRGGT